MHYVREDCNQRALEINFHISSEHRIYRVILVVGNKLLLTAMTNELFRYLPE